MTRYLLRDIETLVTMDADRVEISGGWLLFENGRIEATGAGLNAPPCDEVISAAGCIVTPGLVNTHHHLYQNLTRTIAQDALLFGWLKTLYPIWARMGPEEIGISALVGLAELVLSGCTLSSDHLYLYPNGARLDDTIDAAREIGVRLHATRGSMSIGESLGGLPPDSLVEDEAAILKDCIRTIDAFHDPRAGAMVRVAVAPCSPFSVSRDLMRDSAALARDKGVMLHTHLAENDEDIAYSETQFGCRPGQYAEELGWTGADVWHAHCVKLNGSEIDLFARTGTGVAHCPGSNCRLGSGIAPVRAMRDAGVKLGLGVDGSASNDGADLIGEARLSMLLQRVALGADRMSAREALEIATLGGAQTLGRDDLGSLEPGKRADFVLWPTDGIAMAGVADPVAGLVLSGPHRPKEVWIEGRQVVRDGHLTTIDLEASLRRHQQLSRQLIEA
ncbi:MAG: 8-oxoguanine deaminase [Pseudomonadota bacterium]